MESLKKVITLNQASKLSGYTQDYLGYLIRQGELKGSKVGRGWVTTEDEIKNYIFKQKVRHESLPIKGFLSPRRRNNILLTTSILFLVIFSVIYYVSSILGTKSIAGKEKAKEALSSDTELIEVIKK